MRAITIWQPWAWAIAEGYKPVENRTWRPPFQQGEYVAIHAGKHKPHEDDIAFVENVVGERLNRLDMVFGAIVAVAVYRGYIGVGGEHGWTWNVDEHFESRSVRFRQDGQHQPMSAAMHDWFGGPVGWCFSDIIKLDPIPCRGSQGPWSVKMPAAQKLADQLRSHNIAIMLPVEPPRNLKSGE